MNVNQIEIALSQKISASSTNFELLAAAKALQLLKTNGVFVVSSYGGLPAAASNEGKIYFIEDIETVVWSNGTDWLRLLDKNTIQFQLWGWGYNNAGRIGNGATTNTCSPVREISSSTNWISVSAAGSHTSSLKSSGQIWSWGLNTCGRLGDGTTVSKCSPVQEVSSSTNWCQISSGCFTTSAVKTNGELWSWGRNSCGMLGDGTTVSRCSPVREISSSTDWCQVSSGRIHTSAVKTSGQIWGWGQNLCGRIGDGTTNTSFSPVREISSSTDWCQVSAGHGHTSAVKTSGQIWSWGLNTCGALGSGSVIDSCSPVQEFCSATNWCLVSASYRYTAGIKISGQIWSWGGNNCGAIGDGTTTTVCSPVQEFCSATDWGSVSASYRNTVAIKTTGQIWSWGNNVCGNLGDGTNITRCSPVREISSSTDWNFISAGGLHTAAIKII